jgi:hypothetical protein
MKQVYNFKYTFLLRLKNNLINNQIISDIFYETQLSHAQIIERTLDKIKVQSFCSLLEGFWSMSDKCRKEQIIRIIL